MNIYQGINYFYQKNSQKRPLNSPNFLGKIWSKNRFFVVELGQFLWVIKNWNFGPIWLGNEIIWGENVHLEWIFDEVYEMSRFLVIIRNNFLKKTVQNFNF